MSPLSLEFFIIFFKKENSNNHSTFCYPIYKNGQSIGILFRSPFDIQS